MGTTHHRIVYNYVDNGRLIPYNYVPTQLILTGYITLLVTTNKDCPRPVSRIHGCAHKKANLCR